MRQTEKEQAIREINLTISMLKNKRNEKNKILREMFTEKINKLREYAEEAKQKHEEKINEMLLEELAMSDVNEKEKIHYNIRLVNIKVKAINEDVRRKVYMTRREMLDAIKANTNDYNEKIKEYDEERNRLINLTVEKESFIDKILNKLF